MNLAKRRLKLQITGSVLGQALMGDLLPDGVGRILQELAHRGQWRVIQLRAGQEF
jgi:hypothetical protein